MNSSARLININSRQLLAFLEICRQQTFAKAAEQVYLSPSGMSMLVKELEHQVGARLFERTTRSVTLTDAGRRLLPIAERVVEQIRDLDQAVRGSEAAIRSRVHVAATPTIATSLLPSVIRDFKHTHPHVRVHVSDHEVGMVRQAVADKHADIGFGFFVKPAAGLVRESIRKFRLMRISPPESGAGGLRPGRPWSSLAGLPLVCLSRSNPIQALIETHLPRSPLGDETRTEMNFLGTLIAMVAAGLGHGVAPSFVMDECLRHGLSVSILTDPVVSLDLCVTAYSMRWRTPFRSDGGQHSTVIADTVPR